LGKPGGFGYGQQPAQQRSEGKVCSIRALTSFCAEGRTNAVFADGEFRAATAFLKICKNIKIRCCMFAKEKADLFLRQNRQSPLLL
jgi:hypothetical protein